MALINEKRLNQLKREKVIEDEVMNGQFQVWLNSVTKRSNKLLTTLMDLYETRRFFLDNKLNTDVFKVDRCDIEFRKWSSYANYRNLVECKVSPTQTVILYIQGEPDILLTNKGLNYNLKYNHNKFKEDKNFQSAIEIACDKLEKYCAVMIERLNNL